MARISRSVGIDPGPAKGLHCFDSKGSEHVGLINARSYLDGLAQEDSILICWDAPLTGPSAAALRSDMLKGSDLTQRPIEKFFSQVKWQFKTPKGISTLPYSGCSHWTISRSLLGLPRMGPFDISAGLPFQLCQNDVFPGKGAWIAEVHPAVAMWLWTKDLGSFTSWEYKKDIRIADSILECLLKIFRDTDLSHALESVKKFRRDPGKATKGFDDILDSCIAYILGELWIISDPRVMMLGDESTGSMLAPRSTNLIKQWDAFHAKLVLENR